MFYMIQLQELSVVICALADELLHFEGNVLAPAFIVILKSEIPKKAKINLLKDFYWVCRSRFANVPEQG